MLILQGKYFKKETLEGQKGLWDSDDSLMTEIEAGWRGRWFWEERLPQSFRTGRENVWFTDLQHHHYRELGRKAECGVCMFIRSPGDLRVYYSVGSAGLTHTLTSWSELRLERKGEFKLPCAGVQVRGKFIQAREAQDPIWASQTELAICWGTQLTDSNPNSWANLNVWWLS